MNIISINILEVFIVSIRLCWAVRVERAKGLREVDLVGLAQYEALWDTILAGVGNGVCWQQLPRAFCLRQVCAAGTPGGADTQIATAAPFCRTQSDLFACLPDGAGRPSLCPHYSVLSAAASCCLGETWFPWSLHIGGVNARLHWALVSFGQHTSSTWKPSWECQLFVCCC